MEAFEVISDGGVQPIPDIRRGAGSLGHTTQFFCNATDAEDFDVIRIYHSDTKKAPDCKKIENGGGDSNVTATSTDANMPTLTSSSVLWTRVTNDATTVTVKCLAGTSAPSDTDWTNASACFTSTNFTNTGGMVGFDSNVDSDYIDDVTVKADRDSNGSYETTEHVEEFTLDSSSYADVGPTHDLNGNLTYDGTFAYAYDAWNRLAKVTKAYRDSGGTLQSGSIVSEHVYDGRGRRIKKEIKNSADLDITYHYYLDQDSIVEVRNGSNIPIRQNVWGTTYIDELVQTNHNDDPGTDDDPGTGGTQELCDKLYWAMCDANYNVLGVCDSTGVLKERYEYTPYGQRTAYYSPGVNDTTLQAPVYLSRRVTTGGGTVQAYGLCDVGHQGLVHDEESALVYNRVRMLHPILARFMQWDPFQYINGANLYEYVGSDAINYLDSYGTAKGKLSTYAECQKIYDERKQKITAAKTEALASLGIYGGGPTIIGSAVAGATCAWYFGPVGWLAGGAYGTISGGINFYEYSQIMDQFQAELKSALAAYNACMAQAKN